MKKKNTFLHFLLAACCAACEAQLRATKCPLYFLELKLMLVNFRGT